MFYKFTISGVVQGVGFRPFVHNACREAGLTGYVQNVGEGVIAVVSGKDILNKILKHPPRLARIDSVRVEEISGDFSDFTIRESAPSATAEIPADLYLCEHCLHELRDPKDRRYGYFFITCTNCGPRFSILEHTPYDRANTSMRNFIMCKACKREYENPANWRFHAETIACGICGPHVTLLKNGEPIGGIQEASQHIQNGEVVSIKGIGGFHLVCNTKPDTVRALRALTGRAQKPYAVMVRDIAMARAIAFVNKKEEELLLSPARPIVTLIKRDNEQYAEVSELNSLGLLLPYTALHYLLFEYVNEPLVCTSANLPDEPLTTKAEEQFVPLVLNHNREVVNSIDDSVVKVINEHPVLLRRSRGYVPQSLPISTTPLGSSTSQWGKVQIIALGAELNNTVCVYKDERATLSQHIGNTAHPATFERYQYIVERFLEFTGCFPDIVLCDLHPHYNTTLFAQNFARQRNIPVVQIQHHKAHVWGAAAEHNLTDFVGIACDGLGYGADGTIWGGEVFMNNKRVGHLEQHLQLGGDSAARYPARMLVSMLSNFLGETDMLTYAGKYFSQKELSVLLKQKEEQFNAPRTSSCGRVLDAAAAFLGLCSERTYEGRPAMVLEAHSGTPYKLQPVIHDNILMTTPIFEFLIRNSKKDTERLAATVQHYLAEGLYAIAAQYKKPVVFSGGCAANSIMTRYMLARGVYINKRIPAGDGGISYGQIAYYSANK